MTSRFVASLAVLAAMSVSAPSLAQESDDAALRFLGSIQWECDDRLAFDGAEGGLHDTVSALRVTFDEEWAFEGYLRTSLSIGSAIYTQQYDIAGYAFDGDGQRAS